MDDLGLEEAIDRLGQGIDITVTDAADGRLDARLGQPLGLADRKVLSPPVGMVDQTLARSPFVDGLLQVVQNEARMGQGADPPADDPPGISNDDESDVAEALPSETDGEKVDHGGGIGPLRSA